MKRRTWILSALGATGVLVVGWSVLPARSRLGSGELMQPTAGDVALNGWIKIAADGAVVLAMPRSEMGQGVHTSLAMLVAEELDFPLARMRLEQAGADAIYGNVSMFVASLPFHPLDAEPGQETIMVRTGQWMVGKIARELGVNATGGSSSVGDAWEPLRLAAATARASLLEAAAEQWQQPLQDLRIQAGVIVGGGDRKAHFGQVAAAAAGRSPKQVVYKDPKHWTVLGHDAPRLDLAGKTNGSARFGLDVRMPDMCYAAVRQCPMLGGTVDTLDAKAALAMPGVKALVSLEALGGSTAGFAIVATNSWAARQAVQAVEVKWKQRAEGALDSRRIEADLLAKAKTGDGFAFYKKGDCDQAEHNAAQVIEASYTAPYLAHATMEPMNCTVMVKEGSVELWAPTQVPQMARAMAAKVAGVPLEHVVVHTTLLGGGFGRRLDVDFVAQAVRVAKECLGATVQLLWSREEDTTHDFYRPMHAAQLKAAVDAQGQVQSLRIQSAGDAITPRWFERAMPALAGPVDMPDKTTSEGLFDLPYGFANQRMSHVATRSGVPVGFWRSVGHSHNAFFSESFVDELAHASKQDPLEFRAKWLAQAPRHLAVLRLAAEKSGWGSPLPAGRARGVALHESFGSIVAEVAEVGLQDGQPRVHRVVCAIDCGVPINPNGIAQQMESSVVFGLTAALFGKIDIVDGVVQQTSFTNYPMLQMAQTPVVETHIVPSTRAPAGVGEPGVPPLAPAVANALAVLTGKRLRSLPLTLQA